MQTFLTQPSDNPHKDYSQQGKKLREYALASTDAASWLKLAHKTLRELFQFDHILFMEPSSADLRLYHVYPSYKSTTLMHWPLVKESDAVILNSYHDTLVRICAKGDYATTTISVLQKYMKEAFTDDFSLLFIRKVLHGRFIGLIGFVSFKKDAYSHKDVDAVFAFIDTFIFVWEKFYGKTHDTSLPNHDSNFLSLINLPGMQNVLKLIYRISREDIPILLLGETGTGKEGVANLIYLGSGRAKRPFIKINCGGIPLSLVESKLFGYIKGAFTGAIKDTPGCFELANTGVLLLDELGELPLSIQAHLLRVLQEKVIERVGSSLEIPVNVRVIAATNRDLSAMVENGEFRRDLLYRLSIFPIYIPALRERPEDIPVLLNFFILQQSKNMGFLEPPTLPTSEINRLKAYAWPGNIRELQNAVIRALLLWDGRRESTFTVEVGTNLFINMFSPLPEKPCPKEQCTVSRDCLRMADAEHAHITKVLNISNGRIAGKAGAAELLDMNPSTLRARMKKLGII